jgi:3-oxoacyl-[acyl-carrier protein] reductase
MELDGQVIVITGTAQGLGRKMAEIIARQGAKLALVDLDSVKLNGTAQLCAKAGSRVKDYTTDITDEQSVISLFGCIHRDLGSADAVVNNAGITSDALLVKAHDGKVHSTMSVDQFNKVVAADLRGVFLCGREAAVHMIESGRGGVIVNISSISRAGNVGQTNLGEGACTPQDPRSCHRAGILRYPNGS